MQLNTKLTLKAGAIVLIALFLATSLSSCKKYRKYDNMEVIENTYTGTISIGSGGADPGGDFEGSGDSGTYSFVWDNPNKRAEVNFDVTTSSGSVQIILNDAKDKEKFNQTLTSSGADTYSGASEEGKKGKWLVTIILTNFNGDGSFSISPGS